MSKSTLPRQTKYCIAIEQILRKRGHATNATLLRQMRTLYPDLSATTVHRATARLAERHMIALAPITKDGVMTYDANTTEHDHFICQLCDNIRDISIADQVIPAVNKALGECRVTGRLVVYGSCSTCINKEI